MARRWEQVEKRAARDYVDTYYSIRQILKLIPVDPKRRHMNPDTLVSHLRKSVSYVPVSKDVPRVARPQSNHENHLRCRNCHTKGKFITDTRASDMVCVVCGCVAISHLMHEGEWVRDFKDDEGVSKSQTGTPSDPRFSDAYQLRSKVVGWSNRAQEEFEKESSTGDPRATTDYYKDRQIEKAFILIDNLGERLSLGETAVEDAKTLFAEFRKKYEHLHCYKEKVATALGMALYTRYLKQKEIEDELVETCKGFPCEYCGDLFRTPRDVTLHITECDMIPPYVKEETVLAEEKKRAKRKRLNDIPMVSFS